MIGGKKVLAWIPARGGSKGIKDKNIKDLCGKPLIAYTIESAKNCKYIDEIFVSTDSEKIANVSKEFGVEVPSLRPAELAADSSKTIDAVVYTIDLLKSQNKIFDIFVLLQPTSPLRTTKDIESALELFEKNNFEKGVVSVSEVSTSPILIRTKNSGNELSSILNVGSTIRRQDMPKYYEVNGAIYINNVSEINKDLSFNDNPLGFEMEKLYSVDIDTMLDWKIIEMILNNSKADN